MCVQRVGFCENAAMGIKKGHAARSEMLTKWYISDETMVLPGTLKSEDDVR